MISQLFAVAATKIDANNANIINISATDVIVNILNMVYFVAGITAVIVIILAGYSFASGSYDPARIVVAKNALLYSIVGLIIVMMAFAITQFLAGRF